MRALVCRQHGPPSDLVLEELPAPAPADGEVRIAVRACGINFPDVLMVAGKYQVQPELPFVPGAELSGEIVETGPGVEGLEPGQRVCALTGHGALAEEVCVAASRVVPIPDAMDFDTPAGR